MKIELESMESMKNSFKNNFELDSCVTKENKKLQTELGNVFRDRFIKFKSEKEIELKAKVLISLRGVSDNIPTLKFQVFETLELCIK